MNFHKTYHFRKDPGWPITPTQTNTDDIQDAEMMRMKEALNEVKERLNGYEISQWGKHTTSRDPSAQVVRYISRTIHPRPFCSNAWCKFYELLVTLRLLDNLDLTEPLMTVHLCEAPGGFVCALNHYIHTDPAWHGMEHRWLANTLNPYHEQNKLGVMIPDDRLIRYSISHWLFGEDNTGDLLLDGNISHIIQEVQEQSNCVQLVTADGSIDCQLNPANQELIVYPLILAEVLTAVQLLSPGGTAVLKMFTMFERETIALIFLLNLMFKQVSVHKPVTSKPGNSEVYVVCKGLLEEGRRQHLPLLCAAKVTGDAALSLSALPVGFISQMRECTRQFCNSQRETILANIAAYISPDRELRVHHEKNAEEFVSVMGIRPIDVKLSLIRPMRGQKHFPVRDGVNSYGNEAETVTWQPRKRRLSGNFSDRQSNTMMRLRELVENAQPTQKIQTLIWWECSCPFSHSPVENIQPLTQQLNPNGQSNDTELPTTSVTHSDSSASTSNDQSELAIKAVDVAGTTPESPIYNSCFADTQILNDYLLVQKEFGDTSPSLAKSQKALPIMKMVKTELLCEEISPPDSGLLPPRSLLIVINHLNVSSLLSVFKGLSQGDHVFITDCSCLDRLSAGCFYILWHCFDEVSIAGHEAAEPSVALRRFIISKELKAELIQEMERVANLADSHLLREIVPAPVMLLCEPFHRFVCDINNEMLRHKINHIIMSRALPSPPSTTTTAAVATDTTTTMDTVADSGH